MHSTPLELAYPPSPITYLISCVAITIISVALVWIHCLLDRCNKYSLLEWHRYGQMCFEAPSVYIHTCVWSAINWLFTVGSLVIAHWLNYSPSWLQTSLHTSLYKWVAHAQDGWVERERERERREKEERGRYSTLARHSFLHWSISKLDLYPARKII